MCRPISRHLSLAFRVAFRDAPHLLRTQLLARTLPEQSTRNTYTPRSRPVCTPYAHCGTHVHTACDETRLDAHIRTAWHVQATDLVTSSPTVHENIKHEPSAHTRESNSRRVSPISDKLSQAKAAQGATQRPVQGGAGAGGRVGGHGLPPCPTTAPRLPPRAVRRLGARLRTPERRPSSAGAYPVTSAARLMPPPK